MKTFLKLLPKRMPGHRKVKLVISKGCRGWALGQLRGGWGGWQPHVLMLSWSATLEMGSGRSLKVGLTSESVLIVLICSISFTLP